MRKLTNGSNDSDSTETENNEFSFDFESETETEYAVSIRDGQFLGTYLTEDTEGAVESAEEEHDAVGETTEVTVTDVSNGLVEHVFVIDVVDFSDPEPWERGEGERFSRREHVDPDEVEGVIDRLKNSGLGRLAGVVDESVDKIKDEDFECPKCGLSHGHSIEKHDIRQTFGVTDLFVNAVMEFNPLCHCGLHELSRLVDTYDGEVEMFEQGEPSDDKVSSIKSAAESAPVPDSVLRELDER
jgi:hypothetical protein